MERERLEEEEKLETKNRRERLLAARRPLITDKIKLQKGSDDVGAAELTNSASNTEEQLTVIDTCEPSVSEDVSTTEFKPRTMAELEEFDRKFMTDDSFREKVMKDREKDNKISAQKVQYLTWDDLDYLFEHHQLEIMDIEKIPGYENFEIVEQKAD